MPGFGPLESTDDVRRMIASIVDKIGQAVEQGSTDVLQSSSDSKEVIESRPDAPSLRLAAASALPAENAHEPTASQVLLQGNKEDIAAQQDLAEGEEDSPKLSQRSHGGALPR
jgi:hypothetical protein